MDESEKRYKITKIESYNAEKKEIGQKEKKAFITAAVALGVTLVGWNGMMEYLELVQDFDISYLMGTTSTLFLGGSIVEIVQIKRIIEAIVNKTKLDGRIEEIEEELELSDEDKSRGGR